MALRVGFCHTRGACSLTSALKPKSSPLCQKLHVASCYNFNHRRSYGGSNQGSSQDMNWRLALKFGMAAGITAIAAKKSLLQNSVLAEEDIKEEINLDQELIEKENR